MEMFRLYQWQTLVKMGKLIYLLIEILMMFEKGLLFFKDNDVIVAKLHHVLKMGKVPHYLGY